MIDIIPAIDVIDGKCVRLSKGDYNTQKTYSENPVEMARSFADHGIKRLHLVDLDGARSKHIVNWKTLERIASHTDLVIDFGGGIKADDDLRIAFECGASMVTIGSVSVHDPQLFEQWVNQHGADRIILGADVRDQKIAVSGWLETSELDLFDFVEDKSKLGISKVICTDISKDGMLNGSSQELYKSMVEKFSDIELIASGGVDSIDEVKRLEEIGCSGAIIGKAIYEGKVTLKALESYVS